ncbi:MAG: chloride channel protein [Parvibaculum sp.]|uniref:chloride channel protein n=1 Tax=Parvibaculum sp. TaxID=2024848 RepID=UPI003C721170
MRFRPPIPASLAQRLHIISRILFYRYAAFRRALRSWEAGVIILCAPLGALVGLVVYVIREAVYTLHDINFGLAPGSYLSAQTSIDIWRLALVPAGVGLIFGVLAYFIRKNRSADITDPVEANALFGGRMSMPDSIRLTVATMLSNAAGASVGMEAGYTQMGAAIYSWVAQYFRLRRDDARIFVTAGTASAIAAAFNAPLAGAFYGFELILGSYAPRALAPVAIAALAGALVVRILGGEAPLFAVDTEFHITPFTYLLFAIVGIGAAGFSILTMRAVTWADWALRWLPIWARPAVGGALLSVLAIGSPQVLGSGHGAIQYQIEHSRTFLLVAALLLGKLAASAISLGAGLRGGMFSSSLFLGILLGAVMAEAMIFIVPDLETQRIALMLAGMGAVAAAIIGAPVTMVLLVLEGTGSFPVTMGVLVAVVMASTVTRLTFGYSFSTWRFHLRGVPITGAHDVGWIADLTVGRMMRADPFTVPVGMPLLKLRDMLPLGAATRVFAVDETGRYCGIVDMAVVHDPDLTDAAAGLVAGDLAKGRGYYLLRNENLRIALNRFEAAEVETLPVLDNVENLHVVGYLTEAYALRRYTQELERQRGTELGQEVFPLVPTKNV